MGGGEWRNISKGMSRARKENLCFFFRDGEDFSVPCVMFVDSAMHSVVSRGRGADPKTMLGVKAMPAEVQRGEKLEGGVENTRG